MIGLKSRRKDWWPVVNGEPVKPYELPDDPMGDDAQLAYMRDQAERQAELARTAQERGLRAVADGLRKTKGRGFERVLFQRWTFKYHRLPKHDGELVRFELYRSGLAGRMFGRPPRRWDFVIDFWRAA